MMTFILFLIAIIVFYAWAETAFTDSSDRYYRDEDENDDYFV